MITIAGDRDADRSTIQAFEAHAMAHGINITARIQLSDINTVEYAVQTLEAYSCTIAVFVSMYTTDTTGRGLDMASLLIAASKSQAGLVGAGRAWIGPGWWTNGWWTTHGDTMLNSAVEGLLTTATDVTSNARAHANFSDEFAARTNVGVHAMSNDPNE